MGDSSGYLCLKSWFFCMEFRYFCMEYSLVCLLSLVFCCLECLLSYLFRLCRSSFQLFVVVMAFPQSLVSYYLRCMLSQLFLSQFCCSACLCLCCLLHQWFVIFVYFSFPIVRLNVHLSFYLF